MEPRPIGHRVIVKRLDEDQDRIWLPHGYSWSLRAIVVAVGPPVTDVDAGDVVLFDKSTGLELHAPGGGHDEKLWLVPEHGILCVLDEAFTPA